MYGVSTHKTDLICTQTPEIEPTSELSDGFRLNRIDELMPVALDAEAAVGQVD